MKNNTALVTSSCDFKLADVFKRCDKIGAIKIKLAFQENMSTQKVLKVLLYRERQFLEKAIRNLIDGKPKSAKKFKKRVKNICYLLTLCGTMFDPATLLYCINNFVMFYKKDKKKLLLAIKSSVFEKFWFDFCFIVAEENTFYLLPQNDMPIGLFIRKNLKNDHFRVAKKLKKSLY